MAITVRPDLAGIPDYVPEHKIAGAVVLSSNEVATPPPDSIITAITETAAEVNRYPAWSSDNQVDRLSGELTVEPARLAIGCGSVSLTQQLIQALCVPDDEVGGCAAKPPRAAARCSPPWVVAGWTRTTATSGSGWPSMAQVSTGLPPGCGVRRSVR